MPAIAQSDGELLALARRGDGAAFAIFYRRHLPGVLRYLLGETRDRETTADLSAEVFAAAFVFAHRFRHGDGGSAAPWLHGIALVSRVAASAVRRAIPRPRLTWRPPPGAFAAVISLAVVLAVIVALGGLGQRGNRRAPAAAAGSTVRLTVAPSAGGALTPHALSTAAGVLALRLHTTLPRAQVTVSGGALIARGVAPADRAELLRLAAPGRLELFDWEASVIAPDGRSVAADLGRRATVPVTISQGAGADQPGAAGTGALRIDAAVALASRARPTATGVPSTRPVSYVLLGAAGSSACAAASQATGSAPAPGARCLLAGPAPSRAALRALLPAGMSPSAGQTTAIGPGVALVQASGNPGVPLPAPGDPQSRFFVVRGPVSLTQAELVRPTPGTDAAGSPDVQFGFTAAGSRAFNLVTRRIAHRGQLVSGYRESLNQHIAVAIDGRIVTVPQIDFRTYPDGVFGQSGADITGGFDRPTARALAAVLGSGPLGVILIPR